MNTINADNISAFQIQLVNQLRNERDGLVRVVQALPDDKLNYTPHPKVMTAKDLSLHCATGLRWFSLAAQTGSFGEGEPGIDDAFTTASAVADRVKKELDIDIAYIESLSSDALLAEIAFMDGSSNTVYEYMRWGVLHLVHHRGQLSTYLRVAGCKVPAVYGPSADEGFGEVSEA